MTHYSFHYTVAEISVDDPLTCSLLEATCEAWGPSKFFKNIEDQNGIATFLLGETAANRHLTRRVPINDHGSVFVSLTAHCTFFL